MIRSHKRMIFHRLWANPAYGVFMRLSCGALALLLEEVLQILDAEQLYRASNSRILPLNCADYLDGYNAAPVLSLRHCCDLCLVGDFSPAYVTTYASQNNMLVRSHKQVLFVDTIPLPSIFEAA